MRKLKIILFGAQLVFGALDSCSTRNVISHGGKEYDPFSRPFVHSNGLYAENAAVSLGLYLLGRKLEHKHPKLALAFQVQDAADHAAAWSYTRRK